MINEPTRTRKHGTQVTQPANGLERITAIRRIVEQGQYAKVDGCMIDLFSASAIVKVFDALSEANREKYQVMKAPAMAKIAFKLVA